MAPKFTYFPVFAKGLPSLLAMQEHKFEYEGQQKTPETWPEMKASGICPFGQLPILETEDAGVVAQSAAVLNYIGLKTNSQGADLKEKVVSEMMIGASDEIYDAIGKVQPTPFAKDKVPKEELDKFWAETMPAKLGNLEKLVDKDRFTASGNTVGELHLFATLHQAKLAKPDLLEKFEKLAAFHKRIHDLESTQTVLTGKSAFGALMQYFLEA